MTRGSPAVTQGEIDAVRLRIAPLVSRTPTLSSRSAAAVVSASSVWLKCENLQRAGSFKARGAAAALTSLSEAQRRRGVVAVSSGNHAAAVAMIAAELGIPATVVVPHDAPASKIAVAARAGARVIRYSRLTEDRDRIASDLVATDGLALVHPYESRLAVAGQATAGAELIEDAPGLDTVLVPTGGGGLLAGIMAAYAGQRPRPRIVAVEPERGDDFARSLAAGGRVTIEQPDTIADGLGARTPGGLPWLMVHRQLDGAVSVSDDEILAAMAYALERLKLVAEPSGVVALAALLFRKIDVSGSRVGVVISGGNVDAHLLDQANRTDIERLRVASGPDAP
jgi:threo-3-hydroxy-L-aspartate ammonia-lyase